MPIPNNRVSRRDVLTGIATAAGSVLFGAPSVAAENMSAGTGGPKVWLDMDQQALDAAYDQRNAEANMRQVIGRMITNSEAARRRLGEPLRFAYGSKSIEGLDVYRAKVDLAPINIVFHGGGWRRGNARSYGFLANMFVHAGAHLLVPDFSSVEEFDGDLSELADQARRAVAWAYRNAGEFGGDAARLYVSGHSTGGHLAALVLTTDWQADFDLPADAVKGGLCSSAVFDLRPVRLASYGSHIRFTDALELDMSPIRHVDKLNAPTIVSYGSLETREFVRQSRDFVSAAEAAGKNVQLIVGEGYNHIEIIETLANPYGVLGRAVRQQMQLA